MKPLLWHILLITAMACTSSSEIPDLPFQEYPVADHSLGLTRTTHGWKFQVWSPVADMMWLNLYQKGQGGQVLERLPMTQVGGVWQLVIPMDQKGLYYTFQADIGGSAGAEVVDPYVRLVGINGHRGYIGEPSEADPPGWELDISPPLQSAGEVILYEAHVRDFSIDPEARTDHAGKFLGVIAEGAKTRDGQSTGLDHLIDLGVTHLHLLPSFDFRSLDEQLHQEPQYNWGYDPQNYNVPEGTYSTNPEDPYARVREFKQMVLALHRHGIRVVLDVVYNHTGFTETSSFNQLVPGYYYRQNESGEFSDASACGNEVASERQMVRKFILESVKYWVQEYHIDGFRFDLMGIHDMETMNLISRELKALKEDIFIYGEGWTAGPSPLPDSLRALKANAKLLKDIAVFSDDLRDGIKGSVFEDLETGFVTGNEASKESIKFGIVAATQHPQVAYESVNYSKAPWAAAPTQCINYVSCHDNLTLWDKLVISQPEASETDLIAMHKLANTIVLTSQGVPFLHAGVEFLRSKQGDHNSYKSPDSINSIKWGAKGKYLEVFEYYQSLIKLRKEHPAFRMTSTDQLQANLQFMDLEHPLLVGYWLHNNANGDPWEDIGIVFNGADEALKVPIPPGEWVTELRNGQFGKSQLGTGEQLLQAKSALIFHN